MTLNLCVSLTDGAGWARLLGNMPPVSLRPRELSWHTCRAVVNYRWRPGHQGGKSQRLREEVVIIAATGRCHGRSSGCSNEGAECPCVRMWTGGGAPCRWELVRKQHWGWMICHERERETLWSWHRAKPLKSICVYCGGALIWGWKGFRGAQGLVYTRIVIHLSVSRGLSIWLECRKKIASYISVPLRHWLHSQSFF